MILITRKYILLFHNAATDKFTCLFKMCRNSQEDLYESDIEEIDLNGGSRGARGHMLSEHDYRVHVSRDCFRFVERALCV